MHPTPYLHASLARAALEALSAVHARGSPFALQGETKACHMLELLVTEPPPSLRHYGGRGSETVFGRERDGARRSLQHPCHPGPVHGLPGVGGAGGARSSEHPMQVGTAPPRRPLGLTASLRPWLLALQCGPCPVLTPSAPAGPCDPTHSLGPLTPTRYGRPHSVSKPLRPCPSQVPLPEGSTCPYSPQGAADHSSQQTFPGRPH